MNHISIVEVLLHWTWYVIGDHRHEHSMWSVTVGMPDHRVLSQRTLATAARSCCCGDAAEIARILAFGADRRHTGPTGYVIGLMVMLRLLEEMILSNRITGEDRVL